MRARTQPRRAGDADVVKGCACRHLRVQHFLIGVIGTQVPDREGIGEQIALMDRRRSGYYPQEQIGIHAEGINNTMTR